VANYSFAQQNCLILGKVILLYSPISNIHSSTADRFDENLISKSKELPESWKSGKEWPFPDFSDSRVKEIKNTLDSKK
jgi:hypothetical protein